MIKTGGESVLVSCKVNTSSPYNLGDGTANINNNITQEQTSDDLDGIKADKSVCLKICDFNDRTLPQASTDFELIGPDSCLVLIDTVKNLFVY